MRDFFTIKTGDEWERNCEAIDTEQCQTESEEQTETENEEKPTASYLNYIQSAKNLLAQDFPETKWIVPNILSEGATVFAGAPKQGKSWMALNFAIAVASGTSALGKIPVEKGAVLYLALEDGAKRLQKRLKDLLNGREIPELLSVAFNFPLSNEGGLAAIEEWLEANPDARLVIIDTLKRFRPIVRARQNQYDIDYDAVSGLNDLAQKYEVAILIITHTNKDDSNDSDWFNKVSGSLGLTGAVDAAMLLERPRNETQGKLSVSGRDTEEQALAVQFEGTNKGWLLLGEAFSSLAKKILSWLKVAGKNGLSRSEINSRNGNRANGVDDALRELQGMKLVNSQTIETVSKPQERWYLIEGT